jgi:aminomethyltransferase
VSHRSPAHAAHERLGARFTDFSGWEMPLQYQGTLAEHHAVRRGVGVFDVSHLGRFMLTGPGARNALDTLLCNDLGRISPGRAQYTMMLTEDGGVVDDIIVWWLDEERFLVLPNAGNHETVMTAFAEHSGLDIDDLRPTTALFAVQGPEARAVVEDVVGVWPGRFRVSSAEDLLVAGTGYTGEPGVEITAPAPMAEALFDRLARSAVPCGLGARDTLRLEMGYPLWGQDLDRSTTPLEAGMAWVVGWDHDFVGRAALDRQRQGGTGRELIGFAFDDRRVPRHGYPLRCGESSGEVTSGNFSPTLGVGIGLGYVAPPPRAETAPEVEIRGEWYPANRASPPFVEV